jgi:ATP-binding cassette subfamily B protein
MFLDVRFPTDMFISGVVAPSVLFITMLFIDWRLALAAGIGIPLALLILRRTMRVFGEIWAAQRVARTAANSRMVEYIQGIGVIRAFNLAGARMGQFAQAMATYRDASVATTTRITPAMIGFMTAMEFGFAALIAVSVWLFLGGSLSAVTFLLFLFLGLAFYQPLMLLGELVAFQRIVENAVRNLNEFLQTPTLPEPEVDLAPVGTSVQFAEVRFGYGQQPRNRGTAEPENRVSTTTPSAPISPSANPTRATRRSLRRRRRRAATTSSWPCPTAMRRWSARAAQPYRAARSSGSASLAPC